MKIVALETINIGSDISLDKFKQFGEFVSYETSTNDQIEERCKDADVIILNKLKVNEETVGNLPNLKIVLETATGFDNIDIPYLKSRDIAVCNVKGYSTDSVVQHTFAMAFYLCESLRAYDDFVKDGSYVKHNSFTYFDERLIEIKGKVWGIVGLGNIGRSVAKVAQAFGCEVVYYSTSGRNSNNDFEQVSLDELLKLSDIISIHAPLNENTRNLFNKDRFAKMKKSAILINVGRGPIVCDRDLVDALNSGTFAAAGLDVLEKEPMAADSPLLEIKDSRKLFVTPHIAWATFEARQRLMDEVFLNLQAYVKGERRNRLD